MTVFKSDSIIRISLLISNKKLAIFIINSFKRFKKGRQWIISKQNKKQIKKRLTESNL
jgi:hypothetical protein